jgi:hypothetical protein
LIIVAPSGRTIVVMQPDELPNILDLLPVIDVEGRPASPGAGRKGKA